MSYDNCRLFWSHNIQNCFCFWHLVLRMRWHEFIIQNQLMQSKCTHLRWPIWLQRRMTWFNYVLCKRVKMKQIWNLNLRNYWVEMRVRARIVWAPWKNVRVAWAKNHWRHEKFVLLNDASRLRAKHDHSSVRMVKKSTMHCKVWRQPNTNQMCSSKVSKRAKQEMIGV